MSGPPVYVEITIRATMDEVWERTQNPALHQRWDLRFTDITYLPRPDEAHPQRFLYETRIGFGLRIAGEGESVGTRANADGVRTSALTFWSDDPKSLIRTGSGYWQYVPVEGGVRFLTRYNYETRFGAAGALLDRLLFRPLIGWATAWSFDRLRLWLEEGVDPGVSAKQSLGYAIVRGALAALWFYQGCVPKLLRPDTGEIELVRAASVLPGHERQVVTAAGVAEVGFAAALLLWWRARWPLWLNTLAMGPLLLSVVRSQPRLLAAPFNPVSLNGAMAALGAVGLLLGRRLPSAAACRRAPQQTDEREGRS
ncbi:MAG: DoxX-like family protein [Chloroflexi bacterium]|nr:DoxX-like family protein [Chloroflexota bacterium]